MEAPLDSTSALYCFKNKWFFFAMLVGLGIRVYWAAHVPLANDEAYYWDWGRNVQLSYIDHPPGIAWLSYLAQKIFTQPLLSARGLIPFLHLIATFFIGCALVFVPGANLSGRSLLYLFFLTQVVPVFSLGGILLLPDAGLIFFLSILIFLILRIQCIAQRKPPTWWEGVLVGIAAGFSGLFKYHAILTAAPMLLALLYLRRKTFRQDFRFWFGVVTSGLLLITPVLIWNYQNDWASFIFQGNHGFGGLDFNFISALRTIFGEIVFLTPLFFFLALLVAWRAAKNYSRQKIFLVFLAGFLPLFVVINFVSFFKQTLPHWIIPAFWILIPVTPVLTDWKPKKLSWRLNLVFAVLLTVLLPTVFASKSLRAELINVLDKRPGDISEITFWPSLSDKIVASGLLKRADELNPNNDECPKPAIASLRWFWVSQLAFNLPGQPIVYSFDLNHASYYKFRDDLTKFSGCNFLVIASPRHLDQNQLSKVFTFENVQKLSVPDHLDQETVYFEGSLKGINASEIENKY